MSFIKITAAIFALFLLAACSGDDIETSRVASPSESSSKNTLKTRGSSVPSMDMGKEEESSAKEIEEDEETETLVATAEKMQGKGDLAGANVIYQRAAASNPQSMKAWRGVARIAEARDKPREAIEAYRNMLKIDESYAPAYRGLGRNFMTLGLYEKAVKELEKLRTLKGDEVETLNLLAMAHLRSGDDEKAVAMLELAVEQNPSHLTSKNNLGFAYIMAGRLDDAIPLLEKVIEDVNATMQHRQNLALAYGLAGRFDDARKLAMQDLPPAAVENNIKAYKAMRAKKMDLRGEKTIAREKAKKTVKKDAPKAEEPKVDEKPTEAPAPVEAK